MLDGATLEKAFRGELVQQDPNDEPAEAMIARLRGANGTSEDGAKLKPATKESRVLAERPLLRSGRSAADICATGT
jgi:hypothetical protein